MIGVKIPRKSVVKIMKIMKIMKIIKKEINLINEKLRTTHKN